MKGKTTWVDFQKLKEEISMEMILEHYGFLDELKVKGDRAMGKCPLHGGSNLNQFSVSLSKNIFQCFSGNCKAKGNILDFVATKEGISIREAGLKIQDWFSVKAEVPKKSLKQNEPEEQQEIKENKPLSFELKGLDPDHPYLKERGLSPETIAHFGIGLYAGKGMLKNRVVIPIHNDFGELLAYAGRVVDDSRVTEENPRYKIPGTFNKELALFNLHRVLKTGDRATLVEGFFDVMILHQLGIQNGIGLMGSFLSPEQEELIVQHFSYVTILMDGNDAGRAVQEEALNRLSRKVFVGVKELPEGMEPDQLQEKPF